MENWLGLSYRISSDDSRHRVAVWRRMKELGAVYIHDGFGVLPEKEPLKQAFSALQEQIHKVGGEASILRFTLGSPEEDESYKALFNAARDEEYAEISEMCERIVYELDRETEKGKFTFAEIEENEPDVQKTKKWMERVFSRDYFFAPGKDKAEEMIGIAERRFAEYVHEVYLKNGLES
jgi:hypothetical protein